MKSSMPVYRASEDDERERGSSGLRDTRSGGGGGGARMSDTTGIGVAAAKGLERKPSEDINQSAEAFINNFRHQLLLQRLESIENYQQMLARGQ